MINKMTKKELKILSLTYAARAYAYGRFAKNPYSIKWLNETNQELLKSGACPILKKGVKNMRDTILIYKKDLEEWIERLTSLQECNLHPEKCQHNRQDPETGKPQPFDYADIDMALDQVIGEMKSVS